MSRDDAGFGPSPHGLDGSGGTVAGTTLTYPRFSKPQPARLPILPTPFQPLDPAVINASIPTFFVGRNRDGFWLTRDAGGESGGIFLLRSSAIAFARRASRQNGCALVFLSEPFELDVENQGNRLFPCLGSIARFVARIVWRSTDLAAP